MTNLNKDTKILIVGLGLIGGSYAKALSKKGYHITAITLDEESIEYAQNEGIIDSGFAYVHEPSVREADLIIFALYPRVFIDWIAKYQHLIKSGAVITDVTGVKQSIVYDVQAKLKDEVEFISAHPMAGREVFGVQNSDDTMFLGANYIVVPTERNTEKAISLCEDLGKELGFARITRLSPKEHDEMIGFVSQLTHCIAVSLMTCTDNEHLVKYTGDSFRDLTRIARINEDMWAELFMLNKEALITQIDTFLNELSAFKESIMKEDIKTLKEKMRLSTQRRALFDKKVK